MKTCTCSHESIACNSVGNQDIRLNNINKFFNSGNTQYVSSKVLIIRPYIIFFYIHGNICVISKSNKMNFMSQDIGNMISPALCIYMAAVTKKAYLNLFFRIYHIKNYLLQYHLHTQRYSWELIPWTSSQGRLKEMMCISCP